MIKEGIQNYSPFPCLIVIPPNIFGANCHHEFLFLVSMVLIFTIVVVAVNVVVHTNTNSKRQCLLILTEQQHP